MGYAQSRYNVLGTMHHSMQGDLETFVRLDGDES
jgi:hypothetical protein